MRTFFTFLLLCITVTFLQATHNRAGEITYEQIDTRTIQATILTYSKTSTIQADRDSLEICWGDGQCEMVLRVNGNGAGEPVKNDYKVNTYIGTHTYSAMGTYQVSMSDPNRNGAILNVNSPNSDQIQFHLQSTVNIMSMISGQTNRSPTLLVPPIDVGFVRQPFMHTPSAIDLDGDSVAYELVTPLMENDMPVPNYMQVDEIGEGDNNSYSFDEKTGLFVWNSPQIIGQYNIAIKVKAYRNNELVDMIIRDMQILIQGEENTPPAITIMNEPIVEEVIKVKVGKDLNLDFMLTDVEDAATGGTPELEIFSEFTADGILLEEQNATVLNGTFAWTPTAADFRNRPYYVTVKAIDSQGLATFKIIAIQVVLFSTATSEDFKNAGYQLYPNPTNDQSFLKIPDSELNKAAILSIFDNLGRLITTQKISQMPNLIQLPTAELAKGNYIVQLVSEETNVSTSLVVH